MRQVPELSLLSYLNGGESDKSEFVERLFAGIKDYGFIILKDHPVEQALVDQAYQETAGLFSLSQAEKNDYICTAGGGQRGYTAFGQEHAKDQDVPDLKEFWHVGREVESGHEFAQYYPGNIWPKQVPQFKPTLEKLYEELHQTSVILLEALGKALKVAPGYFTGMVDEGNSILRLINYPPVKGDIPVGAVRAAAHEDINLITILVGATSSGLQLLDRDGSWLDVETRPGELIVDSGDMLSRITNELIPATTHRVINPDNQDDQRFSMPFFVHPNPLAELKCLDSCVGDGPKYPPISSHDFLMQRLKEIGLM